MLARSLRLVSLIIVLAALVLHPVVAYGKEASPPVADSGPSTAPGGGPFETPPPKSIVAVPQSPTGGEDILLIQTNDPWERSSYYIGSNWYDGVTADTRTLDSLGYTYRIANWSDIEGGKVDIFTYPVILIVNDQIQEFYDHYASHLSAFEDYVRRGNTLVFFAAGGGWAKGLLHSPLPGSVVWNYTDWDTTAAYRNEIVDGTHPIVRDTLSENAPLQNADLYNNKASHGYFTSLPASTRIVLRESQNEGGRPTLIDYPLGRGRVIASTLTWEHNWAHWGGSAYGYFARKTLDDVFLYAFSAGTTPASAQLDLRVDDAPGWITVNKSRESYVDFVARVSGAEGYNVLVTLQAPSGRLGSPFKTFTRNRLDDNGYGQENQYLDLGNGQYQIAATLVPSGDRYYKELVWRFKVPASAGPEQNLAASATLTIPAHQFTPLVANARLNIVDYARSILVTNRKLLFSHYQPDPNQNDLPSLLEDVYVQASAYDGEVFYVDLYDDQARDWNQVVNYSSETTANVTATAVDTLIESWYKRLTKHPHFWESIKPEYLLIVGGDEIIPFYRADDRHYYSLLQQLRGEDDVEFKYVHVDDADPTGRVPHEHYLLSDNIYADVGGGNEDWELGLLELSYGRIIGDSAAAMRQFIQNAWLETPSLEQAVMASRSAAHNLTTVRDRLSSRHVAIYGENNPNLTENDQWTRDQWLTALAQPYQVLAYQGHGAYNGWYGTDSWKGVGAIAADQPSGHLAENHPLFAVEACNFGIPTDLNGATWNPSADDNITWKLVSLGAGGILASTAVDTTAGGNAIRYGEQLHNDYFANLIDTDSWLGLVPASSVSERWGTALLKTKQNYRAAALGFDGTDRKTMMEYVYYGLPWSFLSTPDNVKPASAAKAEQPRGYTLAQSIPEASEEGSFTRTITANVGSYQFVSIPGFELLEVAGADTLYSVGKPVLPMLRTSLSLPPGSTVQGLSLVSEHSTGLGVHNIPAADPPSSYHQSSGYTSVMDVSGVYPPAPRYSYLARDLGDHIQVDVSIVPATFNVDTHEAKLYDATQLNIQYSVTGAAVLEEDATDKQQYTPADIVRLLGRVANVGNTSLQLNTEANVYDAGGNLVAANSVPVSVPAGGTNALAVPLNVSLAPGSYRATLTLKQDATPLMAGNVSFDVRAGAIGDLTVPAAVRRGVYSPFAVSFSNYRSSSLTAVARVHIYNGEGIEVGRLLERSFIAAAGGTGSTSWLWEPGDLPVGAYTARAVVQAGTEVYTSASGSFAVRPEGDVAVFLPMIVQGLVAITPTLTPTPTVAMTPTATQTPLATWTSTATSVPADRTLAALRVAPAPIVDGSLAEWGSMLSAALDASRAETRDGWHPSPSTTDLSLAVQMTWDPSNVYVAAAITDDVLVGGESQFIWEDDTLEIGLQSGGHTRQFSFGVNGQRQALEDASPASATDIALAVKKAPGGWLLEAAIPASALGVTAINAGDLWRFTFGYWDDDDGGGGDTHLIRWGASTNSAAATWGYLSMSANLLVPDTPTPTPTPPSRSFVPASEFGLPPVIDGSLGDWSLAPATLLDDARAETHGGAQPHPSAADLSLTLQAGWDSSYLYLAATVQDDAVLGGESAHIWEDDCLELGIQIGGRVRQFSFGPDGRYASLLDASEEHSPQLTRQVRRSTGAWVIEIAIPVSELGVTQLTAGSNYQFTAGYWDDDDGGGGDTHLILWGASTNSKPDGWKPITLTQALAR